jgi:hypothetical protein
VADELKIETALSLARSLTTIKGFPRYEEAITAVAFDLVDWCHGSLIDERAYSAEAQAAAVVNEARLTWTEWTGMADLRALFRAKFEPTREYSLEGQFGKRPPIDCHRCDDIGVQSLPSGDLDWCECDLGQYSRRECPSLLRLCKGKQFPRSAAVGWGTER